MKSFEELIFPIYSAAEVSIQLKNRGDEAYRHKDFGDSIIISRRFTTEGSSTWKIKSKDGKVISSKREELSKICDHMNLQVDNPMTVLTQGDSSQFSRRYSNAFLYVDASRVFLASSNPAERYNVLSYSSLLLCMGREADGVQVFLERHSAPTTL
jgi:hypothetical protein